MDRAQYGDDGQGSEASTGALLHTYGVKYANGNTGVATQLGEGGRVSGRDIQGEVGTLTIRR